MNKWKLGDKVVLNSGSPTMRVVGIDSAGKIWCKWKSGMNTGEESFHPDMLMLANEAEALLSDWPLRPEEKEMSLAERSAHRQIRAEVQHLFHKERFASGDEARLANVHWIFFCRHWFLEYVVNRSNK